MLTAVCIRWGANKYHWWVWGVLCVWVTLGLPCSRRLCFPSLHCLGSRLLCWGTFWGGPWVACTSQIYAAQVQVQVLRYSTKAQTLSGLCFIPFSGPSSSGDQVLAKCTLLRYSESYHLLGPSSSIFVCAVGALSQLYCVSPLESLSLAATLPADVNRPGSHKDLVSNWKPACSLVRDAVSGAKFAPFWLLLMLICLPASSG